MVRMSGSVLTVGSIQCLTQAWEVPTVTCASTTLSGMILPSQKTSQKPPFTTSFNGSRYFRSTRRRNSYGRIVLLGVQIIGMYPVFMVVSLVNCGLRNRRRLQILVRSSRNSCTSTSETTFLSHLILFSIPFLS